MKKREKVAEQVTVVLEAEHIELCDLLKVAGAAESGGHGKQLVADGAVFVDGLLESRKRAKIRAGQRVVCGYLTIEAVSGEAQ